MHARSMDPGPPAYVSSTRSEVLPGLDLDLLVSFVERTDQTAAVREYRRALRDGR